MRATYRFVPLASFPPTMASEGIIPADGVAYMEVLDITEIFQGENMLAQERIPNRSDGCSNTRGSSPLT